MAVQLTETAISSFRKRAEAAKARLEVSDAREPGLRLRVTPPNSRNRESRLTWHLACRDRLGAMRRFELGAYPVVGVQAAREAAADMRRRIKKEGADPNADRKRDRQLGRDARAGIGTLRAELDYYESVHGKTLRSWAHSRLRVERVFKDALDKPAVKLTKSGLQQLADAYEAKQSAAFAVRTLRPALRWLAQRDRVPAALADLAQPTTVQKRKRVLSEDELSRLLPILSRSKLQHAKLFRLLLLTGMRLNEAAESTWGMSDLDAGIIRLPKTKNGEAFDVILSRQAIELLRSIRPEKPEPGAFIFTTAGGNALGNMDRACKSLSQASGVTGWHRHDLRRTAASTMGRLGVAPYVVEAALNHAEIHSGLSANYNTSRYESDVGRALQQLADAYDRIEAGEKNVLRPARAAANNVEETAPTDSAVEEVAA